MAELSTEKPNSWLVPRRWADSAAEVSPMDRLWNRLDGMYPNRWRSAFANEQAIQNWREAWASAFSDDRITTEEIGAALKLCRRKFDWPPSLTEFMNCCRPPIEPETAFNEAVRQMVYRHSKIAAERSREAWSHPAIFWAATEFGSELQTAPYDKLRARWCRALDVAIENAAMGGPKSSVPKRLEELPEPSCSISPEERQAKIDRLKREVGGAVNPMPASEFTEEQRKAALAKIDAALEERGEA